MRFSGEQVRKIILLKKTTTTDEYNQPVTVWVPDTDRFTDGKFYMEWWDQGGKETLESGQRKAIQDVRGKCRFISGLNAKDYRIEKDGIEYDIQNIKEIGRREGQMVFMEARDNQ